MTVKQQTIKKISLLSEKNMYIVLAMVDEMLKQENMDQEKQLEKRLQAYQVILDTARENPVPRDFDYDKVRMEALSEKYGSID